MLDSNSPPSFRDRTATSCQCIANVYSTTLLSAWNMLLLFMFVLCVMLLLRTKSMQPVLMLLDVSCLCLCSYIMFSCFMFHLLYIIFHVSSAWGDLLHCFWTGSVRVCILCVVCRVCMCPESNFLPSEGWYSNGLFFWRFYTCYLGLLYLFRSKLIFVCLWKVLLVNSYFTASLPHLSMCFLTPIFSIHHRHLNMFRPYARGCVAKSSWRV